MRVIHLCISVCFFTASSLLHAAEIDARKDPHYTPSGFFDIHLCNWPDRQPFYMSLYSTEKFDRISSVEIHGPDGQQVGTLDMEKYKFIRRKNLPEKRVFITQIDAPVNSSDGWFTAKIYLKNGEIHVARDYVIHYLMPRAIAVSPADNEEDVVLPKMLSWSPIEEANYYQVFIKDLWDDGKLVYASDLLDEPVLKLPDGVLQPGGYYTWKVHSRDLNEHVQLGDFNMGSNSKWFEFTVAAE